jgi:hypothetical protein
LSALSVPSRSGLKVPSSSILADASAAFFAACSALKAWILADAFLAATKLLSSDFLIFFGGRIFGSSSSDSENRFLYNCY